MLGKYTSGVSSGVHTDVLCFETRINSGHDTQLYKSSVAVGLCFQRRYLSKLSMQFNIHWSVYRNNILVYNSNWMHK